MKILITLFTTISFYTAGFTINAAPNLKSGIYFSDELGGIPCTGSPASSNTLSTSIALCEGQNFTLSLDQVYLDGGITYQWQSSTDGLSYSDIIGANGNNYSLNQTATTFYQCVITCTFSTLSTISTPIMVTNYDLPSVSLITTNISCNGMIDGSIDMTISGGTASFMIDWNTDGFGDNDDAEDISSLADGTYSVIVTDANGCVDNASANIIEPLNISANAFPVDVQCNGASDGEIDLVVTGGTGAYTYDWDNDGTGDNNDPQDLTGLSIGTYNVTVYDANGCSNTASAGIAQPTAISTSVSSSNVTCFGLNNGTINLTVSGGVGGYTFDWNIDGTGDFDDAEDLSGLDGGIYSGVVMDANGCTDGGSITINEPAQLTATLTPTNITCNGSNNGSINLTISGGTPLVLIDWDIDGTGDNNDVEDLFLLSAGTYSVILTDANSCTATASATIINPAPLSATASPIDVLCNGDNTGSINLTVTGGTGAYTFDWDNDGIGDNNDTEDLTSLTSGTYNVTVYDVNNCSTTATAGISEPTSINVIVSTTDVNCFGNGNGAINLTVSGGVGGYTFDWDIDGTGDFNDAEDLSGLDGGNYSGVVKDANGCTDGGTVTILEPAQLVASLVSTNISCNGLTDGSINMTISGGTASFLIDWDNDGTGDNNDPEDLSSLGAGTYTVLVTDNNGCTDVSSASIINPAALAITLAPIDIQCNGDNDGSIGLNVTGGTPGFTYDWNNDGTGDNNDAEDLTGVSGGTYSVIVTDSRGCTTSGSAGIFEPSAINVTVASTDVTCFGDNDGTISLTVTGGTGGYVFDWDIDGTGDFNDTEDLTGLAGGNYTGALQDANGCLDGGIVTIIEPGLLTATVSSTDITCNGMNDGTINMVVTGGNPGYTFDWDNDGTGDTDDTEDLSSLAEGTYNVSIVDTKGCSTTGTGAIVNPPLFSVSMTTQEITCNGTGDGMADVTITGGTLPYSIDWDNDGTGDNDDAEDLSGMGAGTFTVDITDANGCNPYTNTVTFIDPGVITLTSTTTDAICSNIANGTLDLTVAGGNGGFEFIWSNSSITEDLTNVAAGIYLVVVTDTNGCTQTLTDTVAFTNTAPTVTLALNPDVFCNTTTSALALSGESPAGGNWSGTGISANMFNPSVAGIGTHVIIYTYTDGNGCFNTAVDMAQVDDCTGIDEITENPLMVYPNPTNGFFTVNTGTQNGKLSILNAIGETVHTSEINGQMNFDLSGFESGIYFIMLTNENGNSVQKLIKD